MRGVSIGRGAVVAARAVVIRDVAPYTVVAGIPAVVVRTRFSDVEERKVHDAMLDGPRVTPTFAGRLSTPESEVAR